MANKSRVPPAARKGAHKKALLLLIVNTITTRESHYGRTELIAQFLK